MKPASIISLIIAVLLMVVGLVTCFIAQNIAQDNGESLFSRQADGTYRLEEQLKDDIAKIELINLSNVKINIYGNCDLENAAHHSDTSRIEFVNFKENFYTLTYNSTTLSFDQILPNVTSLVKSLVSGGSFKGMRYYLNPDQIKELINKEEVEDESKRIDIYLTSAVQKLNNIKIGTSGTCELLIENMEGKTDVDITGDMLKLSVADTVLGGHLYVNNLAKDEDKPAKSLELNIDRSEFVSLVANADDMLLGAADFNVTTDTNALNLACKTGAIRLGFLSPLSTKYNVVEVQSTGRITADGTYVSSPYKKMSGSGFPEITVTAGEADVDLYGGVQQSPQQNAEP